MKKLKGELQKMKDVSIKFDGPNLASVVVIELDGKFIPRTLLLSRFEYLMFSNDGRHYDKLIFGNLDDLMFFLYLKNNMRYNQLYLNFNPKDEDYDLLNQLVSSRLLKTNSIYINHIKFIPQTNQPILI
jgi:hypothetical protein